MDYIDIIAIIGVIAVVAIVTRFFPTNPISLLGNYMKNLFTNK